nr:MAG TPA: hypothetical protein [Caudoviricetes sp.]
MLCHLSQELCMSCFSPFRRTSPISIGSWYQFPMLI